MSKTDLLRSAIEAAHAAGEILRSGFGTTFERRSKEGLHNLVTEYDLRCEEKIISILREATPHASILAEESGLSDTHDELTWIIDPLDGTVNFAHGIPIFSVSIAATINGTPVCGVIYHPLLQETFTAIDGEGAFLNGRRLSVSKTATLDDSILVTGFPYNVNENPQHCIDQFSKVVGKGLPIRRLGSAALDLAYIAAGRFDGYWEVSLHVWDMAAGVLLVREAGGIVSHYDDREFRIGLDSIVATNGHIHQELVEFLRVPNQ
ncbi:MAG: inositol monophosphatase family protein [Candidatus Kapabacteria bacterium]|nr:inositol monophosphatase family protein [Candidatus Kapabacteria bacterium]